MNGGDNLERNIIENQPCEEHAELVKRIIENQLEEDVLDELEALFKTFGDSTRIKILYVLHEGEMCVCDIASVLGMTQSAISHQLRVLRQMRLVKAKRAGKEVYYALADDHVKTIISMGIEHISE